MNDKEKITTLALCIIVSALFILFGVLIGYKARPVETVYKTEYDTIVVRDTVMLRDWDTVEKKVVMYQKIQIRVHDTINVYPDSSFWVHIERVQKHYRKDSVADIWVSGIDPELDSANIIQRERTIIETKYVRTEPLNNSVGIVVGGSSAAAFYTRNVGDRLQFGCQVGSDYHGKPQVALSAGLRF